jgi:hypothetical protein
VGGVRSTAESSERIASRFPKGLVSQTLFEPVLLRCRSSKLNCMIFTVEFAERSKGQSSYAYIEQWRVTWEM